MRILLIIFAFAIGFFSAHAYSQQQPQQQQYIPPDVLKYKASWDRKKTAHVISTNQQSIASLNNGLCEHDCVAFSECMVNTLSENILYKDYETYIERPMRRSDMNDEERAADAKYAKLVMEISGYCQAKRQDEKENNRLEKVAAFLDRKDIAAGNHYDWIVVNRSDDRLQQVDLSRLEKVGDQRIFWIRQFSPSFHGNYVLSQVSFECTPKKQLIKRYSMLTKAGEEVLGDYLPDKMPIDIHGEDKEVFKLVCPEQAALIKDKPVKKTAITPAKR